MSVNRNYYIVAGCDLTKYRTNKYNDWKWTKEGEQLTCYQRKGYIQFFDDPMDGNYLYFGYILACGDEYEFPTVKINMNEVARQEPYVRNKIERLVIDGVLPSNILSEDLKYEVMVFEECT